MVLYSHGLKVRKTIAIVFSPMLKFNFRLQIWGIRSIVSFQPLDTNHLRNSLLVLVLANGSSCDDWCRANMDQTCISLHHASLSSIIANVEISRPNIERKGLVRCWSQMDDCQTSGNLTLVCWHEPKFGRWKEQANAKVGRRCHALYRPPDVQINGCTVFLYTDGQSNADIDQTLLCMTNISSFAAFRFFMLPLMTKPPSKAEILIQKYTINFFSLVKSWFLVVFITLNIPRAFTRKKE